MNDNQPKRARCAHCGNPVVHEFRPFCSRRCRDVDLGKWLGEAYVVPGRPAVDIGSDENDDER